MLQGAVDHRGEQTQSCWPHLVKLGNIPLLYLRGMEGGKYTHVLSELLRCWPSLQQLNGN